MWVDRLIIFADSALKRILLLRIKFYLFIIFICFSCQSVAMSRSISNSGIIDLTGKEIVPCIYRSATYIGGGLYVLEEMNNSDPYMRSYAVHVVTKSGRELQIPVPVDTVLSNVYLPGAALERDTENDTALPPDSILEIHTIEGCGLCGLDGKIILEPKFQMTSKTATGLFTVYERGQVSFTFDAKTGERFTHDSKQSHLSDFTKVADGTLTADRMLFIDKTTMRWGYYDGAGNVAISPQFDSATNFSTDGLASVYISSGAPPKKQCRLIDTNGRSLESPDYESIDAFHNGLAAVRVKKAGGASYQGIIDKHFNYILEPTWTNLEFLCNDVYAARRTEQERFIAITPSGNTLYIFPPETFKAKQSDDLVLCYMDKNPADPQRLAREGKRIAILSPNGRIIFGAADCQELAFDHGIAVVAEDSSFQKRTQKKCTIITKLGIVGKDIEAFSLRPVTNDRLIKSKWDEHFSPILWKKDPNSRLEQFSYWLREHDLIGMPRTHVIEHFGQPDFRDCYSTRAGLCGSTGAWIELDYRDGTISGWRRVSEVYREQTLAPWVRANMVYDYEPLPRIGIDAVSNLRPKRPRVDFFDSLK